MLEKPFQFLMFVLPIVLIYLTGNYGFIFFIPSPYVISYFILQREEVVGDAVIENYYAYNEILHILFEVTAIVVICIIKL